MIFILLAAFLFFSSSRLFADEFSLTADANALNVVLPEGIGDDLTLVRCLPCEYFPTTEFLREYDGEGDDCQTDGYDTDRSYYSPNNVHAFVERAQLRAGHEFAIPRYSEAEYDREHDKVYDRFYVVRSAKLDAASGYVVDGEIVAGPLFPLNLTTLNSEPRVEPSTIKGLEAFDLDDAKELRLGCAALTIDLCYLLQKPSDPVEFVCRGKTYQFNRAALDTYDAWAKRGTDLGLDLTFVLVFWGHRLKLAPEGWIFPDYELWTNMEYTLSIAAPNTVDFEGVERLQALYEFLGSRYTREDQEYGRVANYVIGNELNSGFIWNNMGRLPLDETIRQYERQLRIAYTALTKYWSGVRVYSSFDNFWTRNSAADFGFAHYVGKGGFGGKEYMTALAKLTREEGDYPWNVAYHPYGLDLRTPVYWDQYSTEQAAKDLDAPRITPYNCEILPQYLATEPMLCKRGDDATTRAFAFTEQGFASPQDDHYGEYNDDAYDPEALPQVWLDRQCAALALAYYKAKAIGAASYIVHRQFDVRSERLNIGLWARPKDQEAGMATRKPAWYMYRDIDDENSMQENAKYLWMLRFYPHEDEPTSWDELLK